MKKALLIVDLQNDFLPNGALAVSKSAEIIPVINQLVDKFEQVITTQDWHPHNHTSFASQWKKSNSEAVDTSHTNTQLWPDHCVQNQWGSELSLDLNKAKISQRFYKGEDPTVDSYSIFFDCNRKQNKKIQAYLDRYEISELYVVGLATDYCILQTTLDALELGFKCWVVSDAVKAVDVNEGDGDRALEQMKEKGAHLILSSELLEKC